MQNTSTTSVEAQAAPSLSKEGYRTSPDHETTGWPPGIPYIVGNEVCERFSFYGMRAILYAQLVALYVLAGELEETAKNLSTQSTHLFIAGVYALPMIGAILSDRLLGKYKTIFYVSLIYCAGHGVLALVDTFDEAQQKLNVMYVGLALIAIGSGGIKPCVSANVGDQFGKGNWFRVRTVFQIFYFSVNFGSFFSTISIPVVRAHYGAGVAFAIPGILMLIATVIFWMGRKKFVHVPPNPGGKIGLLDTFSSVSLFLAVGHLFFTNDQPWYIILLTSGAFIALGLTLFAWRERLQPSSGFLAIMFHSLGQFCLGKGSEAARADAGRSDRPAWAGNAFWAPAVRRFGLEAAEGPVAVLKVISVLFLISIFWALFDQHSSSWIRQAAMMDLSWREEPLYMSLLGWSFEIPNKLLPTQIPAANPLLVMLLIPLMNLVYSACDRIGIRTPPLGRITMGMFIASLSFVAVALIQQGIVAEGEDRIWFAWQLIPYVLITMAEVMVAITALEFAYTQAPKAMKSTVMAFLNLTVTLGNVLVALLAGFKDLPLVSFFWVFAGLMAGAGLIFGIRGLFYVQKDYPQQ